MAPFSLSRRLAAEGLGTALLLAIVVGSGIMGQTLAGGNVAIAQALLNHGADPEARDSLGVTPLGRAINCKKPAVAALLRPKR